jgi:hypothetical protein
MYRFYNKIINLFYRFWSENGLNLEQLKSDKEVRKQIFRNL